MKCPWCNNEMTAGKLYGDRYSLKWLNEGQGLVFGIWAAGDVIGTGGGFSGFRPSAKGHRCVACKKIVIDESRREKRAPESN